jgi:site-specific DNA-methyltransferase (adenine-specific)
MMIGKVHHCSAIELLSSLEDGSIALIPTDPFYGIGYESGFAVQMETKDGIAPRKTPAGFNQPDVFDPSWLPVAAQKLSDDGAMYVCTRWDVAHLWHAAIEAAGLKVVQRIVWDKCLWGAGDLDYYGSQTEDILFCIKSRAHKLRWDKREGNVWKVGRGQVTGLDGHRGHPTQKPVALFTRMVMRSSSPGDLVVDPFVGSGSSLVAGQRLKRLVCGCDIEKVFVDGANAWLEAESLSPELLFG